MMSARNHLRYSGDRLRWCDVVMPGMGTTGIVRYWQGVDIAGMGTTGIVRYWQGWAPLV